MERERKEKDRRREIPNDEEGDEEREREGGRVG